MRIENRIRMALCMAIALGYLLVTAFLGHWYMINDDVTIMNILSGICSGTPDAHVYGVQYPLALLLSSMYRIYGNFDWYGSLLVVLNGLCLFILLYRALGLANQIKTNVLTFIIMLSSYVFLDLFVITCVSFTTTANIVGLTSIFLILTEKWEKKCGGRILSVLLMAICFCLRKECCLMLLPFWAISLLNVLKKNEVKKEMMRILCCSGALMIVLASIFTIHSLQYKSGDWKDYLHFREARKAVHDYSGYPSYYGNEDFYQSIGINGVREAEYLCIRNGTVNTTLDYSEDIVTILESVDEYNEVMLEKRSVAEKLKEAFVRIAGVMKSNACKDYLIWMLLMCMVSGVILLMSREWLYAINFGIGIIGLAAECIALSYRGRLPEYNVGQNIFVIGSFWAAAFLLMVIEKQKLQVGYACSAICLVVSILCGFDNTVDWIMPKRSICIENERQSDLVNEYCKSHPENIYFSPVSFLANITSNIMKPLDTTIDNRIALGGWNAFSPVYYDKLEALGIETTPEKALIYQENTYIMSTEEIFAPVSNYFSDKYGDKYQFDVLESVEYIENIYFNVYKIKIEP